MKEIIYVRDGVINMKREDLRSRIIPTTIGNTNEHGKVGNKKFDTTDFIYLDSYDEQYDGQKTDEERKISATDYARMNNACISNGFETRTDRQSTFAYLRSTNGIYGIHCIHIDGSEVSVDYRDQVCGLCPSLHYNFSSKISLRSALLRFFKGGRIKDKKEEFEFDIREVKDTRGRTIYHTLQIGEYPRTKVDESLSKTLESLYNGGKIKGDISATGRWYSGNGQQEVDKDYAGKHSPEFEYQGNRYVRVVSYPHIETPKDEEIKYFDGTMTGKKGTVRWVKVEPISFVIRNWDEMPISINPKGNKKAKYFDLRAEEVITSNIPFYTNMHGRMVKMWQNSTIRGFLNGIDVRNITRNGVPRYGESRGGNFTGECNFLNEAFNLSRQPIIEYTIPDSETEIPDDAFNGCITLKKLVIHSCINSIGKRAFEGIDFKYAYKTENGELILSQELPNKYKEVIQLDKIVKSFDEYNYSILVKCEGLDEIVKLSETLSKNKFRIPYVYGLALCESGKAIEFCENSDFRFFKSEIPNINDMLLDFPEEERLDFFKFATAIGCFSTEKMLDQKGRETQVLLAQKASSLLAKVLKTDEMRLR